MSEPQPTPKPLIALEEVGMTFQTLAVLRGITLGIPRGQTLAVIGESGCGKTVMLKLLIGLLRPTTGKVVFDGQEIAKLNDRELTRQRLRFGFLFQGAALFDSLTIYDNVAFGLREQRRLNDTQIREVVAQRLQEVGLPANVQTKKPAELSGGMRKRVGLARALAIDPEVMLYDEPTTGLDPIMTDIINELILQVRQRHPVTSVVVTHEMKTVYKVADRVVMLYPIGRLARTNGRSCSTAPLRSCASAASRGYGNSSKARHGSGCRSWGKRNGEPSRVSGRVVAYHPAADAARLADQANREGCTMNEQAMKFRFGIFILASLILLAVLIMLFGGVPHYFTQYDSYTIVVDNAMGVTAGTPVRRSGVKIGEVRGVELDNETGKVLIPILVEHGYTIQEGDRPTIVRGLLGGDVSIDFLPPKNPPAAKEPAKQPPAKQPAKLGANEGAAQQQPVQARADAPPADGDPPQVVPPGAKLKGFTPPETADLVQKLDELFPPAKKSLNEMEKVLTRIDKMMPLLNDTLTEFRNAARATNRFIPELEKTNVELRELTKVTRQTVPDLKKTNDEFQLTARVWGKLGERLDVMLQTNEGKINKTIDQIEQSSRQLARFLSDENQKNLNETLKNTRVASQQFDSIAKNTDEMIKESRVTIKNLNSTVIKANDVFDDLRKVTKPISETSPGFMKNLNQSSVTLNQTLNDLRDLMRDVARSEGTLQKLISDPSLYNNLNDSACMVNRIIPRLDRILSDFEIFADKLARHPESLGIAGVLRPGTGLKEGADDPAVAQTCPSRAGTSGRTIDRRRGRRSLRRRRSADASCVGHDAANPPAGRRGRTPPSDTAPPARAPGTDGPPPPRRP